MKRYRNDCTFKLFWPNATLCLHIILVLILLAIKVIVRDKNSANKKNNKTKILKIESHYISKILHNNIKNQCISYYLITNNISITKILATKYLFQSWNFSFIDGLLDVIVCFCIAILKLIIATT